MLKASIQLINLISPPYPNYIPSYFSYIHMHRSCIFPPAELCRNGTARWPMTQTRPKLSQKNSWRTSCWVQAMVWKIYHGNSTGRPIYVYMYVLSIYIYIYVLYIYLCIIHLYVYFVHYKHMYVYIYTYIYIYMYR